MLITIPDIHLDPANWSVENNANVNPVPMDSVKFYGESDHLRVVMEGPAWGGALITYKPALPITANPLGYTGVDLEVYYDDDTAAALHALECGDLKYCVKSYVSGSQFPNVADMSVQMNMGEGGMWQIDNAVPDWSDTGFKPGPLPANQWNTLKFRHYTDIANLKASFLSIADRGTTFQVPAAMQGMPLLTTGWNFSINGVKTPGLAYQFQMDLEPNAGALEARIRVTLYASDQPIL